MNDREERLEEALQRIVSWSDAYPLDIFPEPDWKKAATLLKAGGLTLDCVSAGCMRHVVEGVGKIAREALAEEQGKQEVRSSAQRKRDWLKEQDQ